MKRLFYFLPLLFLHQSCIQSNPGKNTISGRLIHNCDEHKGVANQELYFFLDYNTPEEDRTTFTDDNGFFSYSFTGPVTVDGILGGTMRYSGKTVLAGINHYGWKAEAGDVYVNTPKQVQMRFYINGSGYQADDSLFISKSDNPRFYALSLAYPFENIIHDTTWTRYATMSTGMMRDYASVTAPFARRLHGTFGSLAYWWIVRNGEIIRTGRDEVHFDACTTTAEMKIDLD